MDRVGDNVYLGNWREARIPELLYSVGVTAILNVAHDHTDPPMDEITFFKCGLVDGSWPKNSVSFPAAVKVLDWLLRARQTVFVHCINGINRAPFVIAYQAALAKGSTWKEEFTKIQRIRPTVTVKPWMDELDKEIKKCGVFLEKT